MIQNLNGTYLFTKNNNSKDEISIIINHLRNRKYKNQLNKFNSLQSNNSIDSKRKKNISISLNNSLGPKQFGKSFLQPNFLFSNENKILDEITKVDVNEVLIGQRRPSDLSNSKKKKRVYSSIRNYNDFTKIIKPSYYIRSTSNSLNNSLSELKYLKKELNRNSKYKTKNKLKIFKVESEYRSVIDENKKNIIKRNDKKFNPYLNSKNINSLTNDNSKRDNNFRKSLNKEKRKLNLTTTTLKIDNSKGILEKLKRQNYIKYRFPKNEIEKYSNGFLISS